MFYSIEITTAITYTEAAPLETVIKVGKGVINQVKFRPRPGHSALCHARVYYHEHQIWPVSREEDLHGDSDMIEWNDYEEIFTDPFELLVRSWNDDDTYPHTFDLDFVLLPESIVAPANWSQILHDIASMFSVKRIFGGGS